MIEKHSMNNLTAHCIIGASPFAFATIKSISPYVDKLILCDVGMDLISKAAVLHLLHTDQKACKYVSVDMASPASSMQLLERMMRSLTTTKYYMPVLTDEIYPATVMSKIALKAKDGMAFDAMLIRMEKLTSLSTSIGTSLAPKLMRTMAHQGIAEPNTCYEDLTGIPALDLSGMFDKTTQNTGKCYNKVLPPVLRHSLNVVFNVMVEHPAYYAQMGAVVCPTTDKNVLGRVLGLLPGSGVYRANLAPLEDLALSRRFSSNEREQNSVYQTLDPSLLKPDNK